MAKYRVGQQIVMNPFVRKGIEYTGRRGFVEIVERRKRYTVLLYATKNSRECTIDVKEGDFREA